MLNGFLEAKLAIIKNSLANQKAVPIIILILGASQNDFHLLFIERVKISSKNQCLHDNF